MANAAELHDLPELQAELMYSPHSAEAALATRAAIPNSGRATAPTSATDQISLVAFAADVFRQRLVCAYWRGTLIDSPNVDASRMILIELSLSRRHYLRGPAGADDHAPVIRKNEITKCRFIRGKR